MLSTKKVRTLEYYRVKVAELKGMIRDNPNKEITVGMLAEMTCLSYCHLRDIFFAVEGVSLAAYIKSLRVERAAVLLRTTHFSLDRIALCVGYINKTSLSRAFKRQYGITPGRFRTGNNDRVCFITTYRAADFR